MGAPYYDRNRNNQWDVGYDEPGIVDADQVLWHVVNDLDTIKVEKAFGSVPVGIEIQVTLWAYAREDFDLDQTIFKRYKIINKSGFYIDSMYIGIWIDPDIGDYNNDLCGYDITSHMAFAYNGNRDDYAYLMYDLNPPALGYVSLQGPVIESASDQATIGFNKVDGYKNLTPSSFVYYTAGDFEWEAGQDVIRRQFYNLLRGYRPTEDLQNPLPYVTGSGPAAGENTHFPLCGDPVTDSLGVLGDVDGRGTNPLPGDRRMMFSYGPLTMEPRSEQELMVAVVGGLGSDHLQSVAEIQRIASQLPDFYQTLLEFEAPLGPMEITLLIYLRKRLST